MMCEDGHDRDIDGDCWNGCPGCAIEALTQAHAAEPPPARCPECGSPAGTPDPGCSLCGRAADEMPGV